MTTLATAVPLAAAIGAAAYTISSTKITAPMRTAITKRAIRTRAKPLNWLANLLACPYCVSHWLAFAATLVFRPWLVEANGFGPFGRGFDFLATSMALVTGAMVAVWLIRHALGPIGPEPNSTPSAPARRPAPANRPPGSVVQRGHGPTSTQVLDQTPPPRRRPAGSAADVTMVEPVNLPPDSGSTDRTQVLGPDDRAR